MKRVEEVFEVARERDLVSFLLGWTVQRAKTSVCRVYRSRHLITYLLSTLCTDDGIAAYERERVPIGSTTNYELSRIAGCGGLLPGLGGPSKTCEGIYRIF